MHLALFLCLLPLVICDPTPTPTPILTDNDSQSPATWTLGTPSETFPWSDGSAEFGAFDGTFKWARAIGYFVEVEFPDLTPGLYEVEGWALPPNITIVSPGVVQTPTNVSISSGATEQFYAIDLLSDTNDGYGFVAWDSRFGVTGASLTISYQMETSGKRIFADAFRITPINYYPTLSISHNFSGSILTASSDPVLFDIYLSEPVSSFGVDQITASGLDLSDFTEHNTTHFSVVGTLQTGVSPDVMLSVAEGALQDLTVGGDQLSNLESSVTISADSEGPQASLLSFQSELTYESQQALIQANFDDTAFGLSAADLSISGGSLDPATIFPHNSTALILLVNAFSDSTNNLVVSIVPVTCTDALGNLCRPSSNTIDIPVDTRPSTSVTPTFSPSVSPSATPSASSSVSPSVTSSTTVSPTTTSSPSTSVTGTRSASLTPSPTPSTTQTPSASATRSRSASTSIGASQSTSPSRSASVSPSTSYPIYDEVSESGNKLQLRSDHHFSLTLASSTGSFDGTISSIQEVDSSGSVVGHVVTNLDMLPTEAAPVSSPAAIRRALEANGIRLELSLFTESGSLNVGSESFFVNPGSLRFAVNISGWTFCTTSSTDPDCNGQESTHLDVAFTIASPGGAIVTSLGGSPQQFSIGGDNVLIVGNQATLDGTTASVATGFPVVTNSSITVRFAKFSSSAVYGSVVSEVSDESPDDSGGTKSNDTTVIASSAAAGGAALVFGVILAMVYRRKGSKNSRRKSGQKSVEKFPDEHDNSDAPDRSFDNVVSIELHQKGSNNVITEDQDVESARPSEAAGREGPAEVDIITKGTGVEDLQ